MFGGGGCQGSAGWCVCVGGRGRGGRKGVGGKKRTGRDRGERKGVREKKTTGRDKGETERGKEGGGGSRDSAKQWEVERWVGD